jgi:1-acyl-sn-glycerol-3-phosphate acyltransferase
LFWPRVARLLLRLGGWTVVGGAPDVHKAVIIGAPHTSNWDGYWALVYTVAVGLDVKFFIKESLFWFPLSILLRGLGAVPLNRGRAGGAVQQAVDALNSSDRFFFGLAPEGTRSQTPGWKSGFYRIAEAAGVPIVFGFFDYRSKRLGIGPMLTLTGDKEADLDIIRSFYSSLEGHCPEKTGPIIFAPRRRRSQRIDK